MKILDLFAGCGGGSLGFRWCFDVDDMVPYEMDQDCIATYNLNFGTNFSPVDVRSVKNFPASDIVVGGPPCQGFSNANTAKHAHDERNELAFELLRAADSAGAKCFVIENVAGIKRGGYLSKILQQSHDMGFLACAHYLYASNYGAPTSRGRWFIVGIKNSHGWYWQPPRCLGVTPTLKDAIGDLPEPAKLNVDAEIDWHVYSDTEADRERAKMVPLNEDPLIWLRTHRPDLIFPTYRTRPTTFFPKVYGRMSWNKPSPTLKTTFYAPAAGAFTHPSGERTITIREGARIMSFPDDFRFVGSKQSVAKQIGNAIPPMLAFAVASSLKEQYFQVD